MFDVITVGSATKDIFLFTKDSTLKPGINSHFLEVPADKKIEVEKLLEFTGGSATNAAATFTRLGKSVAAIAKIGNDSTGDFVLSDFKSRSISTEYLIRADGETPFSTIIVPKNEQMVLLVYRGVERTIKVSELRLDFASKWIYIGPLAGESYKILPELVEYCKEKGIKIALSPGSNELSLKIRKMEPILKDVDIISLNDEEAKKFVGYGNDIKNLVKLGKSVKETAIITKGERGALVMNGHDIYDAGIFNVKRINYVGAGDAFFSAFVTAIMDEKEIIDAISLGSYNAAGVIKHYGAKDGIVDGYPKQKLKIRRSKI